MTNATGGSHKPTSDSATEGMLKISGEQQKIARELRSEVESWQGKIDAAKLQMHLGAGEARDRLRPHVERLEQEIARVEAAWEQLEASSEGAWEDTQHGLKLSLLAIQRSFEKAKKHFDEPGNR